MTSVFRANHSSIQSLSEKFFVAGKPGHTEFFTECSSFSSVFVRESNQFDTRNRFEIGLIPCCVQMRDTENSNTHNKQISPQRHRGHRDGEAKISLPLWPLCRFGEIPIHESFTGLPV